MSVIEARPGRPGHLRSFAKTSIANPLSSKRSGDLIFVSRRVRQLRVAQLPFGVAVQLELVMRLQGGVGP